MSERIVLRFFAGAGLLGLAACQVQTPGAVVVDVAPAEAPAVPVTAVAELETPAETSAQYNQWGGKIPDAKPTVPVDNDALDEVE